jgi:hypothetical protein
VISAVGGVTQPWLLPPGHMDGILRRTILRRYGAENVPKPEALFCSVKACFVCAVMAYLWLATGPSVGISCLSPDQVVIEEYQFVPAVLFCV